MNEDNKYLESLDDDDVIEFLPDVVKAGELKAALKTTLKEPGSITTGKSTLINEHLSNLIKSSLVSLLHIKNSSIPDENILSNGIECRVLRVNQGWEKGKIEINVNVQFYPEQDH